MTHDKNKPLQPLRNINHHEAMRQESLEKLRSLTDAEYHVALMLYNHKTNRDIAREMGMKLLEVYQTHQTIYDKLEVTDLVGLIKYLCKLDVEYLSYDDLRR